MRSHRFRIVFVLGARWVLVRSFFGGGNIYKKRPTGCLNSPNDGEKEQGMKKTPKNARKNLGLENSRIIGLD